MPDITDTEHTKQRDHSDTAAAAPTAAPRRRRAASRPAGPPQPALPPAVGRGLHAHAPGQLEWQHYGCERAARCGVDPSRVVNTWRQARLLEWTADHAARGSGTLG